MKKREEKAEEGNFNLLNHVFGMPKELNLDTAFSIIAKERSYDFIAPTTSSRDAWLSHLQIFFVHSRTFDNKKVMQHADVVGELRAMSMAIGALKKKVRKSVKEYKKQTNLTDRKSAMSAVAEDDE